MKYIRLIGIPLMVASFYICAWVEYRPKVWHDKADVAVAILMAMAGFVMLTCPFELPWEEK